MKLSEERSKAICATATLVLGSGIQRFTLPSEATSMYVAKYEAAMLRAYLRTRSAADWDTQAYVLESTPQASFAIHAWRHGASEMASR